MPLDKTATLPLYHLIWSLVDEIFPPVCAGCSKPGAVLCESCYEEARVIRPEVCLCCGTPQKTRVVTCPQCKLRPLIYSGMLSWAHYEGTVRESIHSLKYKNNIALGYLFALKLFPLITAACWSIDLVVPVPLSRSHLKSRGYNQSALISRPLSKALHVNHDTRLLTRIRETATQAKLSAEERFLNVKGAFSGNTAKLINKNILLVDDVITTGATMVNCTEALLESGASKVYCVSVARVFVG